MLAWAPRVTVTGKAEPERVSLTYVSEDLFKTLGVAPAAGRWFVPTEGRPEGPAVVMVSAGFAERRFGTPESAVGAPLTVDGHSYTVVGVMPVSFRFLHDVAIWAPMRRGEGIAGAPRQFHNWLIVGRLKSGMSKEGAQRQVDFISNRLEHEYPVSNAGVALQLDPLQDILTKEDRPQLLILMGAVGLVLLIACAKTLLPFPA